MDNVVYSKQEKNHMPSGIQNGSHGTESELSNLSQENLRNAVYMCYELANSVYSELGIQYVLSAKLLPSQQGMDLNFYPPFKADGSYHMDCTGEALFTYNGKPILLVTRAFAENGADSTVAKLYRRQYWYDKVKSYNPYFSHITFISAKRQKDFDNFKEIGSDLVYPHDINEFIFGQNSVYLDDNVRGEKFYKDTITKALNKCITVYKKTY